MERLTNFNAYYNEYDLGDTKITSELNQKVYNKLGKIEDILEKYKIDSLDQLQYHIDIKNEYLCDYQILQMALDSIVHDLAIYEWQGNGKFARSEEIIKAEAIAQATEKIKTKGE